MFDTKNINKINKKHEVYYQIQGQLHITGRNYCMLVIHTPHNRKLTRVNVDHDFWKTKTQLIRFYMDCLLPELVDSRHNRNMPIRNPQYTEDAIQKKKSKKNSEIKRKRRCLLQVG